MANVPAYDPVQVIDHDMGTRNYPGYVVVTFASHFSGFSQTYKLSKGLRLKGAMDAFGSCVNWYSDGLKYIYEGKVIEDNDTPFDLHMKNGDQIEVLAESKFSGSCSKNRMKDLKGTGFQCLSFTNPDESVVVKLRLQDGISKPYRIKMTTSMCRMMDKFSEDIDEQGLKFSFDGQGISPYMTAEQLGIEDGEVVDVFRLCYSG